jgi:hypothetical protein
MTETAVRLPFQVDHIIAEQHGGPTILSNLAWSCLPCNKRKGPNLSGIDRKTRRLVPLFHPRRHAWRRHFRRDGPLLRGRTPIGRATVQVLGINDRFYVAVRQTLIEEGLVLFDDWGYAPTHRPQLDCAVVGFATPKLCQLLAKPSERHKSFSTLNFQRRHARFAKIPRH